MSLDELLSFKQAENSTNASAYNAKEIFSNMSEAEISTEVLERLKKGGALSYNEARWLLEEMSLDGLVELSHTVTQNIASKAVSLCSITNVKSGHCSQDCKWCAQSIHYETGADVYGVKDKDVCLAEAKACYEKGVEMFSLVASGRRPNKNDLKKLLEIADHIREHVPIKLCASLGLCTPEMLKELKAHGINRYHCNLESSPTYFENVVTTHSILDKVDTLKAAEAEGMELCSGGIIGMGESALDRLDMAFSLKHLNIKSIPINVLHPIEGTPLGKKEVLSDEEILRCISLFRLINPDAHLRFAGGRILLSDEMVNKAIYCGMNAAIVGDMLTTLGSDIDQDRNRFLKHHYTLPSIPNKVANAS